MSYTLIKMVRIKRDTDFTLQFSIRASSVSSLLDVFEEIHFIQSKGLRFWALRLRLCYQESYLG
jgi:hypothetical protein